MFYRVEGTGNNKGFLFFHVAVARTRLAAKRSTGDVDGFCTRPINAARSPLAAQFSTDLMEFFSNEVLAQLAFIAACLWIVACITFGAVI